MRLFVVGVVSLVMCCSGCGCDKRASQYQDPDQLTATNWDRLTIEAATGRLRLTELASKYDARETSNPGVYAVGNAEKGFTNIWVDASGSVTACVTWLGPVEDEFIWDLWVSTLVKRFGPPFSVHTNQVLWPNEIELARPLPGRSGRAVGSIIVRWPMGGVGED